MIFNVKKSFIVLQIVPKIFKNFDKSVRFATCLNWKLVFPIIARSKSDRTYQNFLRQKYFEG